MKVLPRQILLSYLPQAGLLLSTPILVKVLTNNLTLADYGGYVLINNLANYCMFIAGLGIHRYLARAVPGSTEKEQYGLFAKALAIEIVTYLLLLAVLIVFISPLSRTLNIYQYRITTIWFLGGYVFYFVHNEILRFLGFQKRLGTKALLSACQKPLLLAVLLCPVIWWGGLKLEIIFPLYVGVFVVLFVATASFLKGRYLRKVEWNNLFSGFRDVTIWLPSLFLIDMLFKTKDVLPRYFLSKCGGNEMVGLYALSDNLVRAFYLLVTPFIFILYPYIAEQLKFGREQNRIKCHAKALSLLQASYNLSIYAFVGLASIGFCYGREFILLISKASYLQALGYLPYFIINYLLVMFVAISHPILILIYNVRKLWAVYVLFLIANIAVSYFLIAKMLIGGAILGTILTNTGIAIYIALLLRGYLKRVFTPKNIATLAVYFMCVMGSALLIREYLPASTVLKIALTSVLVAAGFFILRRKDIETLFHPVAEA